MPGADVDGAFAVAQRLRAMGRRARNLTPVWPEVGDAVASTMRSQFDLEGRELGTRWAPLNPQYRAWKVAEGLNPQILVATGAMRQKFRSRPMNVERYSPTEATFGSRDRIAMFHQYGTRRMPARPILYATDPLRREIAVLLRRHIVGRGVRGGR